MGEFPNRFHSVLILRVISERGGRCIYLIADYKKRLKRAALWKLNFEERRFFYVKEINMY